MHINVSSTWKSWNMLNTDFKIFPKFHLVIVTSFLKTPCNTYWLQLSITNNYSNSFSFLFSDTISKTFQLTEGPSMDNCGKFYWSRGLSAELSELTKFSALGLWRNSDVKYLVSACFFGIIPKSEGNIHLFILENRVHALIKRYYIQRWRTNILF